MANLLDRIIYYLKDAVVRDNNGGITVGGAIKTSRDTYEHGVVVERTDVPRAISHDINSTGGRAGLWDITNNKWIIRHDSTGITYVGDEFITVGSHSSPIGTVLAARLASALSVDTATGKSLCSISLPKGTWQLIGQVRFPTNNTGVRRANITTTNNGNDVHVQVSATQDGQTALQVMCIAEVTGTSATYYLNVYHNAGVALTMPAGTTEGYINGIRAVRIA